MKKPRVLHVCAVPTTAVLFLAPFIHLQTKCGHEVELACNGGEMEELLQAVGVPWHKIPMRRSLWPWHHLRAIHTLTSLLRQRTFDAMHTHTPIASLIARVSARIARVPVVIYHMHGSLWDGSAVRSFIFSILERLAARWTSRIITVNCEDATEVVSRRMLAAERVSCVHCGGAGVDAEHFNPRAINELDRNGIRQRLELPPSAFVVTYIGRLVEEKGILDLLEGFHQARTKIDSLYLLVVGGHLESERDKRFSDRIVNWLSTHKQTQPAIKFVPFTRDIRPYLSIAQCLVLPSHREGFGMAIAEAAFMEIPAIATNTRGAREALIDGKTGLLIPKRQPEAIAAAICRLFSLPDERAQMAIAARHRAVREYSQETICKRILSVYDSLGLNTGRLHSSTRASSKCAV